MSQQAERWVGRAIAVAALIIAVAYAWQVIRSKSERDPEVTWEQVPAVYIEGWEALRGYGSWVGDSTAPVTIVEFSDFECPFCRRFSELYHEVAAELPGQAALLYVHHPLASHRFARPAVIASECAGDQGRFAAMHDALFAAPDSFGLKEWRSYATEAQVPDLAAFDACVKGSTGLPARVSRGIAFAPQVPVSGTPTVLLNGWRLPAGPYDSLAAWVQRVKAGEKLVVWVPPTQVQVRRGR